MTSAVQIAYPAYETEEGDEEVREVEHEETGGEESAGATVEEREDALEEEQDEGEVPAGDFACEGYVHRESGRAFDVSPEEFCAEPYEQGGDFDTRLELGRKGEEAAVRYLVSKGYEIVKRNWFCHFGEVDIIAYDPDGSLCFVEVKTRRSIEAGFPEEAITKEKRRRYERIALAYMMVMDDWDDNENVRFDAVCICVTGPHRAMLRHHKGCFDASI